MSGFTKHQSTVFLEEQKNKFSQYINEVINALPQEYTFETIFALIEKYFPFELQLLSEGCSYYNLKDNKLSPHGKKIRHRIPKPVEILKSLKITKRLLSFNYKKSHNKQFDKNKQQENIYKLNQTRLPKINKIKTKIETAKKKAQLVEPMFLDKLMGLYDRKTTTQKDKVYIFKELEKYYCPKTIKFFKKKVDTEYNMQLRRMAFLHMQGFMHFVTLRKQKYMRIPSKNKKRRKHLKTVYAYEKFSIESIPEELEYRINNSNEQKLKKFDFFISHSSIDFKEVQTLIHALNKQKQDVYCDWMNDTDYLKRNLLSDATKTVIEKRLDQSKNVIFVNSHDSQESKWVKYELNYFHSLNRSIFEVSLEELKNGKFNYQKLTNMWFLDKEFKKIDLLN
ncbi:toll/interleukin-1 receptor domain-containing protein [Carboxylicivirga sediminis]|uniref:Toll/interleukin-1 receptor domain-containing protein n=1 Tax=Carboxylicivirga sediminis TaxID=2006564 RepID=A0A941F2D4_9BACT|nr:toll/interleukin-1 receptor domain-containing protein [Carboxylicivirga sediminis]MBR8534679.1 toll/interleukin-1 receptor domain-containing protein [Carboxylicivirga sediminis]